MKEAPHTTVRPGGMSRPLRVLPIFLLGLLMLCSTGTAPSVQKPPTVQPSPQMPSAPQGLPSTPEESLLTAARRKVLLKVLDQLQQQTREAESALKQQDTSANGEASVLLADVQALHERVQNVQQQLNGLTRVGPGPGPAPQPSTPAQALQQIDERIQQLTRQREELAQTAQQLEAQLQQLPPSQEPGRRQLQSEVARIQGQLRNLDTQLAELRRERLRADYEATLQAAAEPNQAPQVAQEMADLSARLQQLQNQVQQNQQELEQMQDRSGPRARALEVAIDGLRRQIQAIQDRLRQTEQEQAAEKIQAAGRQQQTLESCVQQLGQRLQELTQTVAAIRQELQGLQNRIQQMEQTRTAGEEAVRRTAQQGLEQLRAESRQQQEELRNQVRGLEERLNTALAQAGAGTEGLRRELEGLRTDMQRMGRTIGRLERERLDAQATLQARIQQLESQVCELRKDVAMVEGSFKMLLSQMGRSTVGSAGCPWGW